MILAHNQNAGREFRYETTEQGEQVVKLGVKKQRHKAERSVVQCR